MASAQNLRQLCAGVLVNDDFSGASSHESVIEFQGTTYTSFMDYFYVDCPTEMLTATQVSVICRERDRRDDLIGPINESVKAVLRKVVFSLAPRTLLEIGAGARPLCTQRDAKAKSISYVTTDADALTGAAEVFSANDYTLGYMDGDLDVAVAVFVLHFQFYDAQIVELARCLHPEGVFIANVYRRDSNSRQDLKKRIEGSGLKVAIVPDPLHLCRDHEYWLVGKSGIRLATVADLLVVSCSPT